MRALLTVTHTDAAGERYVLECPHGLTKGQTDSSSTEPRQKLIAGLMARHGLPFGCTCAAETDLVDVYPTIASAVEQIRAGATNGLAELDDKSIEGLAQRIRDVACPSCSVAIMVLPLHLPLVFAPLHDLSCPNAIFEIGRKTY